MFQSGCHRNQVSIAMRYEAIPIILIICVHILRLIDLFDSHNRQTEPKYQISVFFQLSSTFIIGFKNIPFFIVHKLMT